MIGRRFARRIWRTRIITSRFRKKSIGSQGTIDLVGRDVKKSKRLSCLPIQRHPMLPRQFQQGERSDDIRLEEGLCTGDGTVDMRLRSQMDNSFGTKLGERARYRRLVADVGLNKMVVGMIIDGLQ